MQNSKPNHAMWGLEHEQMQTETMTRPGVQGTHRLNTQTLRTRRGTGEERGEGGGQVC